MAMKSVISRDDRWFAGEDKRLLFTVYKDARKTEVHDVSAWTFLFEFYVDGVVVFTEAPTPGLGGEVAVDVPGERTETLTSGSMHYVLWRADPGGQAVIAFGDVVLGVPSEV